jgi:hypothetical protein
MVTLATQLGELSLVLNSVRDGGTEPQDESQSMTESVAMGPHGKSTKTRVELLSLRSRPMTLDSDVTSLLQRQDAAAAEAKDSPVPLQDRTTRVQVVRGARTGDVQLGGAAAAGGNEAAAAAAPAPTPEAN